WRQVVARTPNTVEPAPRYENGWNALNQLIREDYSWNGREPNVFYTRRDGRYFDLSGISGLDLAEDSRAFAATDLDGDGNLDLLLKSRLGPQLRVFRNECGTSRQSLALHLIGTKSNRDAIGARVDVEIAECRLPVADCQQTRTLSQFVRAGSGYLSQHTKTLYFGLGEATAAVLVRVRWPSGLIQEFQNLAAGFRYEILEGKEEPKKTAFLVRKEESAAIRQSAIGNWQSPAVQGENTPRLQETWLLEPALLPQKHAGPGFVCLAGSPAVTRVEGVPFEVVDLTKAAPDTAAVYALFRRYLFDWRADLVLPLVFLVDAEGLAHKIYPSVPPASVLHVDLEKLSVIQRDPAARQRLALPFEGQYSIRPARRYFQLGAAFLSAGYPEQALQYLSEIVRQTPVKYKAQLAIGQIHLDAGRLDEAHRALEMARELNPQSPEVWNNLGGVQAARGNHAVALEHYEKALSFKATLPYVLNNAAQAYAKTGDRANAEKLFRRVLELDSQDADAANQLGLLLAQQNRTAEARQLFQQAIAVRRDHAGAINNLGVLYSQMNQFNDAIAAFQYGISVAPDSDNLYLNLARLYVRLQERNKARDTLQRLLERKPNDPVATQSLRQLDGLP
ncbi:MAG TPA: tetratricopeptide repeat protein, partial [Terriglobia bacterium]|nr:tetratricopeptide repeat protein [Terriglobia bacterium]